ncbi:P-loop NTPase [Myxococcota bacterium]
MHASTDPESGQSLAELGTVTRAEFRDSRRAEVDWALSYSAYPRKAELASCLQGALTRALGVQEVTLRIRLDPGSRPIPADDPLPGVGNVVWVMSGKGGVGKSTVATNLAVGLARTGARVGLLDADVYGPSIPTMFGTNSRLVGSGQRILPVERHGIRLVSMGFLLEEPHAAVVWRGPMLHGALSQFISDVEWGTLDYFIVDLPPGTGDVAITLSQKTTGAGVLMVTTPQQVAATDVFRAVTMCQKVGIPVLGVIENQSYFTCEHGRRYELFGAGGGAAVAEMAQAPLLAQIPLDSAVRQWGDAGTPVVAAAPSSPAGAVFLEVVDSLAVVVARANRARTSVSASSRPTGRRRRLRVLR